ncbi:MAG TPA: PadR family transcriptional regulator [Thermoplasmata archaeon]|nr:PadR family transcriptional regulator [Thermoplasmata archaeon]
MTATDFLLGLLGGLVFAVVLTSILWWVLHRRIRRLEEQAAPVPRDDLLPPELPDPPVEPGESSPEPPSNGAGLPSAAVAPSTNAAPGPSGVGSIDLRLSSRILIHLASQPRLARGSTFSPEQSQGGMVGALDVAQGPLANVLRRLVAAGLLEESREHVHGGTRRLKVYRLTGAGERLARDLRHRPPG